MQEPLYLFSFSNILLNMKSSIVFSAKIALMEFISFMVKLGFNSFIINTFGSWLMKHTKTNKEAKQTKTVNRNDRKSKSINGNKILYEGSIKDIQQYLI